jgi:hypothetical protein
MADALLRGTGWGNGGGGGPILVIEVNADDGDRENTFGPWTVRLTAADHKYTVWNTATNAAEPGPIPSVSGVKDAMFPEFVPGEHTTNPALLRQWAAKGELGRRQGTLMHATLEACLGRFGDWYDGAPVAVPPPAVVADAVPDGPVVRPGHLAGLAAHLAHTGLVPVQVERCTYDGEMGVAGTFDALFYDLDSGEYCLCDWKRRPEYATKSRYGKRALRGTPVEGMPACHSTEALVQLNLYHRILARGEGIRAAKMAIVTIHPSRTDVTFDLVPVDLALQERIAAWWPARRQQQQLRRPI